MMDAPVFPVIYGHNMLLELFLVYSLEVERDISLFSHKFVSTLILS